MALNTASLQGFRMTTQIIVSGFIRALQKELGLINIPPIILYLCIKSCVEKNSLVQNGKSIAIYPTSNAYGGNVMHTKIWIESTANVTAKWKIRIDKFPHKTSWYYRFLIKIIALDYESSLPSSYGFTETAQLFTDHDDSCSVNYNYSTGFKQDDILSVVLDTNKSTIASRKNDDELVTVWSGIKATEHTKYLLSVITFGEANNVSLVEFDYY